MTDHSPMRCYAATDNSLLWEVRGFPHGKRSGGAAADGPMFPPPAFWHFLTPRDAESSKALRTVEADAVQALLEAGTDGEAPDREQAVRAAAARVLPEVRDPGVLDGVIRAVGTAARLLERRRAVSQRAALIVSGARVRPAAETTDTALVTALRDLLAYSVAYNAPKVPDLPATVAAIAADGAFLRGRIDDATRRVGPPARPRDWAVLLGDGIEAAAWRCLCPATPEEDRAALSALLRTWAASPFAEPGLSLIHIQGPAPAVRDGPGGGHRDGRRQPGRRPGAHRGATAHRQLPLCAARLGAGARGRHRDPYGHRHPR